MALDTGQQPAVAVTSFRFATIPQMTDMVAAVRSQLVINGLLQGWFFVL